MLDEVQRSRYAVVAGAVLYGVGATIVMLHHAATGTTGTFADPTLGWVFVFAMLALPTSGLAAVAYALVRKRRIVTPALPLAGFTALILPTPADQGGLGNPFVGYLSIILATGGIMVALAAIEYAVREAVARLR